MNPDTVRNPAVVNARQHITDAMEAISRAMDDPNLMLDPTLSAVQQQLHVLRLRLGLIGHTTHKQAVR